MFSNNKGITEMQRHNQVEIEILRCDYEEETEGIRGARIRASGCLILRDAEAEFEARKNFKLTNRNFLTYVTTIEPENLTIKWSKNLFNPKSSIIYRYEK
ncbi:hypothetical protein F8M41_018004 [Gigaspora margarita]|uniref:Uncharacterized protein n=1 Tax=Gigaspora margarita TaxID=4874 RepID=A0A8H4ELR8_GIGMA|nr:hypothetical protein F8M41_018004 [Gigaspora margarita]